MQNKKIQLNLPYLSKLLFLSKWNDECSAFPHLEMLSIAMTASPIKDFVDFE